jgi:sodium/hydrogen antiporter
MTSPQWFLLVGALFLLMGITYTLLKRSPFTSSIIYLAVGILVGPTVLNLFHFNPLKESAMLEVLTEVVVLISLFSAGVKMPTPFVLVKWSKPILLATVSMVITVLLLASFVHVAFGFSVGAAILLGAILAPTDPVLATDIQTRHLEDRDALRFTLTSEAGMNDGSAFPFVIFGLGLLGYHNLGHQGLDWVLVDLLWATIAGVAIGLASGYGLAHFVWKLRREPYKHALLDDFLGLGLIGVVYGLTVLAHAWGFLAVFFAAVALRQTEAALTRKAQEQTSHQHNTPVIEETTVSEESLLFKEHLERLSEVVLILLIGGSLFINSWSWKAVSIALFLFIIARPISVFIALINSTVPWRIKGMSAWFGVRGIGSLYYLMYAIQHGINEELALELTQITLIVVTLSIIMHGVTVKPLMQRIWLPYKKLQSEKMSKSP